MPRKTRKTRKTELPKPKVPAHERLLSRNLADWAGEAVARGGRRDALLGKVESLRLTPGGDTVEAKVRGERAHPYAVSIRVDGDELVSRCTCDDETHLVCRHAVAALEVLRFPLPSIEESSASAARRRYRGRLSRGRGRVIQQAPATPGFVMVGGMERTLTREERVGLQLQEELKARRQRARREKAEVKRMAGGRVRPPRFKVTGKGKSGSYTVTLRGKKFDQASCTCPDFAKNELATCKHIERAKAWFSRKRKILPENLFSAWWRPREWMQTVPDPLREIRVDPPIDGMPESLAPYFGDDGWMLPAPEAGKTAAFARKALEAAEKECRARGWTWDLDAEVGRQIEAVEAQERTAAELADLDEDSETWREVVPHLGFDLHRYQVQGALFLARTGRAFLADDMGLGKTIQAIVAALLLRRAAGAKKALIVCPASLKHQWRREIHKACGEHAVVVEGRRALRLADYKRWRKGFLVVNYELVLRDLDVIKKAKPDLLILDEAQRIKNWDTKTAKAAKELASPHAFILTGTPLENRLAELHSLVEFLNPRALGPRWRLLPFHAVADPQGRILAYQGLDIMRSRLSGFFLRRERGQVLDQLPARTENTFWTELTAAQRRPYRRLASRVAALLSRNQPLRPNEIRALLQGLTSMRILCNGLAQHAWPKFEKRVLGNGEPPGPAEIRTLAAPKLEEFVHVMDDLLQETPSKVVVFSQWERMLRLANFVLRELLDNRGERAEVFHGGLTSSARTRILEEFRDDPSLRVLFSTDAGGQGLNLQESASVVVHLEVPWNPAVLEQRVGRVHRMGQRESVQVLHFVTRDAIEERVRQVVESKRQLFEGLLVEEADHVVFENAGDTFVERLRELIDSDSSPSNDPPPAEPGPSLDAPVEA